MIDLVERPAAPSLEATRVSVIMPVYQGERIVLGAVRSALNQSHANLEVIVVDDGSTDATLAVLASVRDPRLIVLQQANAGTAAARNTALAHAGGAYIAFLDADDRWFPSKLETELRVLRAAADPLGVAYSSYYAVDDAGRLLNPAPVRNVSGRLLDVLLDGEDFLVPSTCLFDRRIFERIGGFRTARFHEDHDLILRVARAFPMYATGEHLVVYRQSTSGKCRSIIADFERARGEELALVDDLADELTSEQRERLRRNVLRGLYCRFLMYGFNGHARRLLPEVEIDRLRGTKKGLIAWLSAKSGVNLLILARLAVQSAYRGFGQRGWRARLATDCLELAYDGATTTASATRELPGDGTPRVCIAIPTFRRPEHLRPLLAAIAAQQLERPCDLDVLVIDNDMQPTAREVVAAAAPSFPFPLRYEHEPEPGLAVVRNHALRAASGHDFLAMIDDDEIPQTQWLAELLRVAQATGADAVVGPVPKTYPVAPPDWIRRGRFYDLPQFADGAALREGYSGNCLVKLAAQRRVGLTFDPALNLAGGEDLFFFRQWRARGATIHYAARAVAFETIGPARLRASYLIKLSFRRGNSLAFCDRRLSPPLAGGVARAAKGYARFALGVALLAPLTVVRGRAGAIAAACHIAQGLGSLAGLTGFVYLGYDRGNARTR